MQRLSFGAVLWESKKMIQEAKVNENSIPGVGGISMQRKYPSRNRRDRIVTSYTQLASTV